MKKIIAFILAMTVITILLFSACEKQQYNRDEYIRLVLKWPALSITLKQKRINGIL